MNAVDLILLVVGILVGVPILAYMVMKFGTAGFLRALRNQNRKEKEKNEQ